MSHRYQEKHQSGRLLMDLFKVWVWCGLCSNWWCWTKPKHKADEVTRQQKIQKNMELLCCKLWVPDSDEWKPGFERIGHVQQRCEKTTLGALRQIRWVISPLLFPVEALCEWQRFAGRAEKKGQQSTCIWEFGFKTTMRNTGWDQSWLETVSQCVFVNSAMEMCCQSKAFD